MRRARWIIGIMVVAVGLSGCLQGERAGIGTPPGLLVTVTKAPSTVPRGGPGAVLPEDYDVATVHTNYIGFDIPQFPTPGVDPISFGWGDMSWERAMEKANMEEVYFADYRKMSFLNGLFTNIRLEVYGKRGEMNNGDSAE